MLVGAGAVTVLLLTACLLALKVAGAEPSLTSFTGGLVALLLLAAALLFAYWTYGCWSLRYILDRHALTITWAGNSRAIPLAAVTELVPAEDAPAPRRAQGLHWPGYWIGAASVPGAKFPATLLLFSTHRHQSELTYLVTANQTYALSIPDRALFAAQLRQRAGLSATGEVEGSVRRWPLLDWPAWHDPWLVRLIAVGLLANLALFAYQSSLMPGLPELVPLQLTAVGAVGRAGAKELLLTLPAIGLVILVANSVLSVAVHRLEPLAAHLCITTALAVQVVLWAATLKLLG